MHAVLHMRTRHGSKEGRQKLVTLSSGDVFTRPGGSALLVGLVSVLRRRAGRHGKSGFDGEEDSRGGQCGQSGDSGDGGYPCASPRFSTAMSGDTNPPPATDSCLRAGWIYHQSEPVFYWPL